jgi:flagellar hook assembly protein FlgD
MTVISFGVAKKTFVHLALYDVQGRLLRTMLKREVEAGVHQVTLDIRNLPKGIYMYKIQAQNFNSVKRLIVE